MNAPLQILLTALLVGGGLFAYHVAVAPDRGLDRPGEVDTDLARRVAALEQHRDAPPPPARVMSGPELAGRPHAPAPEPPPEAPRSAGRVETRERADADVLDFAGDEIAYGGERPEGVSFPEPALGRFRAMLEEVERRRNEERMEQRIRAQLETLDLRLGPDQETAVIQETIRFEEKRRETWAGGRPNMRTDEGREQMRRENELLRGAYVEALAQHVSTPDAEKIAQSLAGRAAWISAADGRVMAPPAPTRRGR